MMTENQVTVLINISTFSSCWRLWWVSQTRHPGGGGGWPWPSPGSGPPPASGPQPQEAWGHQDRGWGGPVPALLPQGPCRVQVWPASAPQPPLWPPPSAPQSSVHTVQEHRGPRHRPGHPRPEQDLAQSSPAPGSGLAWLPRPDLGYQDWRGRWLCSGCV